MQKKIKLFSQVTPFVILLFLAFSCLDGGSMKRGKISVRSADSSSDNSNDDATNDDEGKLPTRPSGQIYIKSDYCACLNGEADILNNCASFCKGHKDSVPTLYASTYAGPDVANNPQLKDLYGWCNNEIEDGLTNPGCKLEVYDGEIRSEIEITITGKNTFIANLNNLSKNKTYILTLVESNSGSLARSKSFQIIRKDISTLTYKGPLKIAPVHQYSCISRASSTPPTGYPQTSISYDAAIKQFYYYPEGNLPPALPPNQQQIFCHDIIRYGEDDNPLYPRLELIPHSFHLWSENDLRFYDSTGAGKLDINDEIQKRLMSEYGVESKINYFNEQTWEQYPNVTTSNASSSSGSDQKSPRIGFIMLYWLESDTNRSYCPKQSHFNSDDPSLRILKDYIVGDTEGIYLGVPEADSAYDYNGEKITDTGYLLIRENLLKKIWFYFENGKHFFPNDITAGTKTLMFYWPADINYPHIRKSNQRLYSIRSFQEAFGGPTSGIRVGYKAHDKKFGCVPSQGTID